MALAAGLIVLADGDRLVIRGPRSADAVARRLLAHKAVILAAMAADDGSPCPWDEATEPGDPCPVCGSLEKWWDILGGEHCQQCEHATLDKGAATGESGGPAAATGPASKAGPKDCARLRSGRPGRYVEPRAEAVRTEAATRSWRAVKMSMGRLQKGATFCAENRNRNTVVDILATNE